MNVNGRTDIDEITTCSAEADRHGWRRLHVSQWGRRWMRVTGMGCCVVDLYHNGGYRVFYTRSRNGGMVFVPGGSISDHEKRPVTATGHESGTDAPETPNAAEGDGSGREKEDGR